MDIEGSGRGMDRPCPAAPSRTDEIAWTLRASGILGAQTLVSGRRVLLGRKGLMVHLGAVALDVVDGHRPLPVPGYPHPDGYFAWDGASTVPSGHRAAFMSWYDGAGAANVFPVLVESGICRFTGSGAVADGGRGSSTGMVDGVALPLAESTTPCRGLRAAAAGGPPAPRLPRGPILAVPGRPHPGPAPRKILRARPRPVTILSPGGGYPGRGEGPKAPPRMAWQPRDGFPGVRCRAGPLSKYPAPVPTCPGGYVPAGELGGLISGTAAGTVWRATITAGTASVLESVRYVARFRSIARPWDDMPKKVSNLRGGPLRLVPGFNPLQRESEATQNHSPNVHLIEVGPHLREGDADSYDDDGGAGT